MLTVLIPLLLFGDQSRIWTDSTGAFRTKAVFIEQHQDVVVLERVDDKKKVSVPRSSLSEQDRRWLDVYTGLQFTCKADGRTMYLPEAPRGYQRSYTDFFTVTYKGEPPQFGLLNIEGKPVHFDIRGQNSSFTIRYAKDRRSLSLYVRYPLGIKEKATFVLQAGEWTKEVSFQVEVLPIVLESSAKAFVLKHGYPKTTAADGYTDRWRYEKWPGVEILVVGDKITGLSTGIGYDTN